MELQVLLKCCLALWVFYRYYVSYGVMQIYIQITQHLHSQPHTHSIIGGSWTSEDDLRTSEIYFMCGRSKENTSKTTAASPYLNNQGNVMNLCGTNIMHDNDSNLGGLLCRSFRAIIGAGILQTENKHPKAVSTTAVHASSGFQCQNRFSLQQNDSWFAGITAFLQTGQVPK